MNSSIFNFRSNVEELRKGFTPSRAGFVLFLFIYLAFLYFLFTTRYFWLLAAFVVLALLFIILKRYRKVFGVIFCSGFLFLAAGEIYFRLSYFGPAGIIEFGRFIPANIGDPLCVLEYDSGSYTGLKPNAKGRFKGGWFETNILSFRDRNHEIGKKAGTTRILVLGTSISMGSGVDQDESYPAILERLLNHSGKTQKYEVINLSMGGYGIEDMLDAWKRFGEKFRPDMILIEEGYWAKPGLHPVKPLPRSRWDLVRESLSHPDRLFFFFAAISDEFIPYVEESLKQFVKRLLGKSASARESLLMREGIVPEEKLRFYFEQIKALAAGRRVFIVALRPVRHLDQKHSPNLLLARLCSEYGFGLIDTYSEDYGTNVKDMIIYFGDRHPNARAHEIYARAVLRAINSGAGHHTVSDT